jgi:putative Mg2+ transporter-C (MgtC) family protein
MLYPSDIIVRLLLSTLLGGIIGFERQAHGRPAGFRTQLLVCVACTLLMIISEHYYAQSAPVSGYIRFDPTRIAAGAMTGIGFLGAGVILKTGATIQGLTTAACIWIVAAIGLAVGAGQYVAGISGFVITVYSLYFLRIVERKIPQLTSKHVTLITDESGSEEAVVTIFKNDGFEVSKMEYEIEFTQKETKYIFTIATTRRIPLGGIIKKLSTFPFIKRIEIKN